MCNMNIKFYCFDLACCDLLKKVVSYKSEFGMALDICL